MFNICAMDFEEPRGKQAEFSESLTNVSACLRARFFHDNECYEFAQRLNMS